METLHCTDPKSLMPSTFNLNMTNFKVTNIENSPCIMKGESDTNSSGRPVSIILTRAPSASNNYVHVLCCSLCDFSTLLLSNLKDHIKNHHSTIESILLLSCSHCGSTSTEKNLLDEHMKLYHFNYESSTYKFVETRHAILNSESVPTTNMTIPFTFSSPPTTASNLRLGLSSPPHLQQILPSFPLNSTTASSPQPSIPTTVTSAVSSAYSHSSAHTELNSIIPEKAIAVQGSRRRKATTPGKLSAAALVMNGEGEGKFVGQASKRMKIENEPDTNGYPNKISTASAPSSSNSRSQTAMVCSVNGFMDALKCQQQQQQQQGDENANINASATPKVTTAIMMDANSAKNLISYLQLLAAAVAGQGKIEVGGVGSSGASATTAPTSSEQALDMSMRPTVEAQNQLQAQMKSAELKLADLIQPDQLQGSTTNGLDALRSALTAQLTGSVMAPPSAGVQHITIGLPSNTLNSTGSIDIAKMDVDAAKQLPFTSQFVNVSQLQAFILALACIKPSQVSKVSLNEVISSQMMLPSAAPLVTNSVSAPYATPLMGAAVDGRFSESDLALASTLTPPDTANSLNGITLPSGEFIPVTSLIAGQPVGLGSFALTSSGPPSSLTSFVTSLSGAPTASIAPIITSTQHQTSLQQPPPPSQLPFDAALFAASNSLSIAAPPGPSPTSPIRNQALSHTQSLNNEVVPPITVVSALPRTDSVFPQSICETTSCAGLEELVSAYGGDGGGAGTQSDISVVVGEEDGVDEGLMSSHLEVTTEESGSPISNAGVRKATSTSGKACRRTGSGLGTRPHRQNFTALQNRILTDWYNLHHYKPYPSTEDTKMLAQKSELTYSQVKKWFANKRARTSNNGIPKPLPPTASDTPSTAAADTSAFVAAAVAAAAAANQSSLLSNGSTGVMLQSQQIATKASGIIVPSGLMVRPNGAPLAATSISGGGLTILAPRPPHLSSYPPIVAIPTTSTTATTSPKSICPVVKEEISYETPSVLSSPADTDAEDTQQPPIDPTSSLSIVCSEMGKIEDNVVREEEDEKIKETN